MTAVNCAAAERGGLMKKEKETESSWVKLKVFRPKNMHITVECPKLSGT